MCSCQCHDGNLDPNTKCINCEANHIDWSLIYKCNDISISYIYICMAWIDYMKYTTTLSKKEQKALRDINFELTGDGIWNVKVWIAISAVRSTLMYWAYRLIYLVLITTMR